MPAGLIVELSRRLVVRRSSGIRQAIAIRESRQEKLVDKAVERAPDGVRVRRRQAKISLT
jgi:hypothetical protein